MWKIRAQAQYYFNETSGRHSAMKSLNAFQLLDLWLFGPCETKISENVLIHRIFRRLIYTHMQSHSIGIIWGKVIGFPVTMQLQYETCVCVCVCNGEWRIKRLKINLMACLTKGVFIRWIWNHTQTQDTIPFHNCLILIRIYRYISWTVLKIGFISDSPFIHPRHHWLLATIARIRSRSHP